MSELIAAPGVTGRLTAAGLERSATERDIDARGVSVRALRRHVSVSALISAEGLGGTGVREKCQTR
jgi:hypothetical protein